MAPLIPLATLMVVLVYVLGKNKNKTAIDNLTEDEILKC